MNNGVIEADKLLESEVGDDGPSQKPVFEFRNCKEVYYEGRGVSEDITVNKDSIRSSHTDAKVTFEPEGHTRENKVTSFRTAIAVTCCEKVEIKNATFSGLEYGVFLMKPNNKGYEDCNGDVTISNIRVTDTSQPIFVADTRNVTIENVDMKSREKVGSGEHFVYCSRFVDNVYIKDCKFDYKDHNYGCAINLRNSEETADALNNSVKFCRIDNVEVTNMYRQFVSAKADTRIICNNCKVSTRNNLNGIDSSVANNYIAVFFVGQRASIDVINCTVVDQINKYMIASLRDDVQVNVSGGKFTGLYMVGNLGATAGNEMNSINLNVSSAEIETYQPYIRVDSKTKAYFYANFNNCKLFTHAKFCFRSDTESCRIACYNCEFKYSLLTGQEGPESIAIAYYGKKSNEDDDEEPKPLLDNIKVINCTGDGIRCVASYKKEESKATDYGNYFSYTVTETDTNTNIIPMIYSTCVHEGSITLNKLSPELQAVIAPLLTTS